MKRTFFIILVFFSLCTFSQKDTIINFYNFNNQKSLSKPNDLKFIEVLIKKNDTLWRFERYKANGHLFCFWHSKTKDSQQKIGQFITFDKNDSISSITYYNQKGLRSGRTKAWFPNRNVNYEGSYKNGKRNGVWKFFHFNGKIAARGFFKNDTLIKQFYFDEFGKSIKVKEDCCTREQRFKGGINKFRNKLKKFTKTINYQLIGDLYVDFSIDINGNIDDVEIYGYAPNNVKQELITFFKNIKGWEPAIHLNRKVPSNYFIKLNFK